MLVQFILILTNIWGLFALDTAFQYKLHFDAILVTFIIVSSILMHLTETKHNLIPPYEWAIHWSYFCLNLDRSIAVFAFLWYIYFWDYSYIGITARVTFIILVASILSYLGEQTNNLTIYVICHTIWHLLMYSVLDIGILMRSRTLL